MALHRDLTHKVLPTGTRGLLARLNRTKHPTMVGIRETAIATFGEELRGQRCLLIGWGLEADALVVSEHGCQTTMQQWTSGFVSPTRALPYQAGTFGGVLAHCMLGYVPEPREALIEMKRVMKAGGRIIVIDADWQTLRFSACADRGWLAIQQHLCSATLNGEVAARLPSLLGSVDFRYIAVSAYPLTFSTFAGADAVLDIATMCEEAVRGGACSARAAAEFQGELEDADAAGTFFASLTMLVASAYAE